MMTLSTFSDPTPGRTPDSRLRRIARSAALVVLAAAAVFVAARLLFAAFCLFTHYRFAICDYDYTTYLNTIWNTGHGRPFEFQDGSYLGIHLSFSLALLAPFFHIWDHPFLLSVMQWLLILGGALALGLTARRFRLPLSFILPLLFLYLANHFTQTIQLCEFHGVTGYLLLVPFAYYTLVFSKRFAWLPFVLLLGLREDAGLMVAPLFFYVAVKDRWRAGYVYAVAALLYAVVAIFVLFPAINGASLFEIRSKSTSLQAVLASMDAEGCLGRGKALLWILLPILPLLAWAWRPWLALVTVPLLVSMLSPSAAQHELKLHYSAVVMAFAAVALLDGARVVYARDGKAAGRVRTWLPLYLVVVALLSYHMLGFLPGCRRKVERMYRRVNREGYEALCTAVRHVPRTGTLMTHRYLVAFVANRDAFITHRRLSPKGRTVDIIFCRTRDLPDQHRQALEAGTLKTTYQGKTFIVLQRADG